MRVEQFYSPEDATKMENVEQTKSDVGERGWKVGREWKKLFECLEKNKRARYTIRADFSSALYNKKALPTFISYSRNSWPMSRKWRKTRSRGRTRRRYWGQRNIFTVIFPKGKFKFKDLWPRREIKNDFFSIDSRGKCSLSRQEKESAVRQKKSKERGKKWHRVTHKSCKCLK